MPECRSGCLGFHAKLFASQRQALNARRAILADCFSQAPDGLTTVEDSSAACKICRDHAQGLLKRRLERAIRPTCPKLHNGSALFNLHRLTQIATRGIKDQNLIVCRDNSDPIRAAGEVLRLRPVGQGDVFGEIKANRRAH